MRVLLWTVLIAIVNALPVLENAAVTQKTCDVTGQLAAGVGLTIYNNLWNYHAGPGIQCTSLNSFPPRGQGISWTTTGTWHLNEGQVKSYANVGWKAPARQLSAIRRIDTHWAYHVTCNGHSDVSYDLFTSPAPGGTPLFEVMVWLTKTGPATPISATGVPIATHYLAGQFFDLYRGRNNQLTVYSFVSTVAQGRRRVSFIADLKAFIDYLIQTQGLPASHYLDGVSAGFEMFVGDRCVLDTFSYTIGG